MKSEYGLFGLSLGEVTEKYNELREVRDGDEADMVRQVCEAWKKEASKFDGVTIQVMNEGKIVVSKVTEFQGVARITLGVLVKRLRIKTYDIDVGRGYFENMRYSAETDQKYIDDLIGSAIHRFYELLEWESSPIDY